MGWVKVKVRAGDPATAALPPWPDPGGLQAACDKGGGQAVEAGGKHKRERQAGQSEGCAHATAPRIAASRRMTLVVG